MESKTVKSRDMILYLNQRGDYNMRKIAMMLYPNFSLQEVTCLTSALTIWFGESIDYIASENKEYLSEEGLRILPTKTTSEVNITDYECVILPGTINPLAPLFDDRLIACIFQISR